MGRCTNVFGCDGRSGADASRPVANVDALLPSVGYDSQLWKERAAKGNETSHLFVMDQFMGWFCVQGARLRQTPLW
jgi:hypothetical protein